MHKYIILLLAMLCVYANARANRAYSLHCKQEILELSENIALSQVGVKEKSNNNDGEPEKYLHSVGLKKGNPYCLAGQYWSFKKAVDSLGLKYKEIPIPKTGLVYNIFHHAEKYGKATEYYPSKHCFLIWIYPNKRKGHIERIIEVGKAGWVKTIAFNTSKDYSNSRDGEGVYIKNRNIYNPLGRLNIIRLVKLNDFHNIN